MMLDTFFSLAHYFLRQAFYNISVLKNREKYKFFCSIPWISLLSSGKLRIPMWILGSHESHPPPPYHQFYHHRCAHSLNEIRFNRPNEQWNLRRNAWASWNESSKILSSKIPFPFLQTHNVLPPWMMRWRQLISHLIIGASSLKLSSTFISQHCF